MNLQNLLNKYGIKANVSMLLDMWNESHRSFHTLDHLNDIIDQINESYGDGKIDEQQKEKLYLTALFHDIVYEPTRQDNEERSADFFMSLCNEKTQDILDIRDAILDTKTHQSSTPLAETFNKFDMNIIERDFDQLLNWEHGIHEEYKVYGDDAYKAGRLQFIGSLLNKYPMNYENLKQLIDWVETNY